MSDNLFSPDCPLCLEFAHPDQTILSTLDDGRGRVLANSDGWRLVPSLGPLREHHLMLLPVCHYRSMAHAWSRLERTALLNLMSAVQETFAPGDTLIFEHGEPETGALRAGACIDHAHLHILPKQGHLIGKLSRLLPFDVAYSSLEETLEKANREGYQLVGTSRGSEWEIYLRSATGPTPSQFLRRLVADAAGAGDVWDWRNTWNLALVEETCRYWRVSAHANIP